MNAPDLPSTRPYLIRALYEWCTDNGFTPYLVVRVNGSVRVPREYVHNGEIVLNVSYDATSALQLGNDFIEFKARFGGKPCDILVPVPRVVAIYARENGQGMAFPLEEDAAEGQAGEPSALPESPSPQDAPAVLGSGAAPTKKPAGPDKDAQGGKGHERAPVQLQSVDGPGGGGDPSKPHSPSGGGARPALKRIK